MIIASPLKEYLSNVSIEWMPLGSIGELLRGGGMQKKDFVEEGFPAIHYGQIHTKYGLFADRTFSFVSHQLAKKLRKAQTNDLLLATTSENDDDVAKPLAWLGEEVAISGDMMIFRHQQNAKYLAYVFQTEAFQREKNKIATGIKVRRASSADLAKIKVPIPYAKDPDKSLAVQSEIVRILDALSLATDDLTSELTTELHSRIKQHKYYRQKLLDFDDENVVFAPLGEVCDFQNGFAYKSELFRDEGLPIVRIKNVSAGAVDMNEVKYFNPSDYKEKMSDYAVSRGDILVAMSGATTGKIGCYGHNFTAYLNQRVGKFLPKTSELCPRYLYHFLLSQNQQIYTLAGGGAQPNLSSNILKAKLTIPIPYPDDPARSLAAQEKVAATLDQLDELTASLTKRLPLEIELRQKQYNYYRDWLLSFPKPDRRAVEHG